MYWHKIVRILWSERELQGYCEQGENCGDVVQRERTFSELIIVTCVSVGDVVMPNIVRVLNTSLSNKCTNI